MDFINEYIIINWWKDSFIIEGLGIFLTNLFIKENEKVKYKYIIILILIYKKY
jgi:hypothetical protein